MGIAAGGARSPPEAPPVRPWREARASRRAWPSRPGNRSRPCRPAQASRIGRRQPRPPPRARPRTGSRTLRRRGGVIDHSSCPFIRDDAHEQHDVGRPVRRAPGRGDGGDQRLDRLRPQARRPGHRRLRGPSRHARRQGIVEAADAEAIAKRSRPSQRRNRGGNVLVLARARRHPYERREPARRDRRPGGRAAAHRALAQRPGRASISASGCATRSTRSLGQIAELQRALATRALDSAAMVMPGFTHLQSAQPVTFGHHLLAYVEMLGRDAGASRTRASASTNVRSARRRSPAPRSRSTAT